MQNSAPGVNAGVSKIMPAIISSHVASTTKTGFTWDKDVEDPGVGNVERSSADSIMTL